jgi:hypothetical protein
MKKNKHNFYSDKVKKFPHAVWQSFLSISPHILGGTMATSQRCCHLPGEMLNSAAECADRARIVTLLKNENIWFVNYNIDMLVHGLLCLNTSLLRCPRWRLRPTTGSRIIFNRCVERPLIPVPSFSLRLHWRLKTHHSSPPHVRHVNVCVGCIGVSMVIDEVVSDGASHKALKH